MAFGLLGVPVSAQQAFRSGTLETITYRADTPLRDFVGLHLGDPDLWPYVLQINQISDLSELKASNDLKMPVQQVRAADDALEGSLRAIQNATAEGAQLFAPQQIGDAISSRESAVDRRGDFQWGEVVDLSNIATLLAQEALEVAIAQRDLSAEAIVSDVQGDVQGRAPAEPRWSGRGREDILVEFERVRTLSKSTTQITFRDLSRLRLNSNSNATIQRMRSDPLTGDEVTKVSLVNGDFYAVLNQLSERVEFEIDVPGLETNTTSSDFWVKNDVRGASFVNYDDANLEITRDGTSVILGENEGAYLGPDGTQTSDVFGGPTLLQPALDVIIYNAATELSWDQIDDAAGYWLEISRDAGFNEMQLSEWGIATPGHTANDLPPDRYYWRVSALDALGLPGEWSKSSSFAVRNDTIAPFLTLLSPGDAATTLEPSVLVFGATEPDATVMLNGTAVEINTDGSFEFELRLNVGENAVVVEAQDLAGNEASIAQSVIYRPATSVEINVDPAIPASRGTLLTKTKELSVRAQTTALPGAPVSVLDASGTVLMQTVVGDAGSVAFSLPVTEQVQSYSMDILSPDGKTEGTLDFAAQRDITPPVITLEEPLPRATDNPSQQIAGSVEGAIRLELNGAAVPMVQGHFTIDVTLERDVNDYDLVATDAVGNVTPLRLRSVYDVDPPIITQAQVTRPNGNNGGIVISLAASDASGLRKSATYVVEIAGVEQSGFLRCESASGICMASLPAELGQIQLIEVAVEDYAGNIAFR